jgi:hypothetical protein
MGGFKLKWWGNSGKLDVLHSNLVSSNIYIYIYIQFGRTLQMSNTPHCMLPTLARHLGQHHGLE